MMSHLHLISLLVGINFSILLPIVVWFDRKRIFVTWARIASIIACIAGLGWGFIGLALLHSSVIDWNYSRQEGIKGMLGGICIGLALSLLISKPYVKRVT
jgi:hypothetical protein